MTKRQIIAEPLQWGGIAEGLGRPNNHFSWPQNPPLLPSQVHPPASHPHPEDLSRCNLLPQSMGEGRRRPSWLAQGHTLQTKEQLGHLEPNNKAFGKWDRRNGDKPGHTPTGGTGSGLPGVLVLQLASPGRGSEGVSSTHMGKGRVQPQKKRSKDRRRPCSILVEHSFPFEDPRQAPRHLPSIPASLAEATGSLYPTSRRVIVLQHPRRPPPPTTAAAGKAILNRPPHPKLQLIKDK